MRAPPGDQVHVSQRGAVSPIEVLSELIIFAIDHAVPTQLFRFEL